MTLPEFVLARLAEDEERASSGWSRLGDARWECTDEGLSILTPSAVLADVEAKRRIVEDWTSLAERLDDQGRPLHMFDPVTSMLLKATEPWIRALATVYAAHADYREEWKP